MPDGGIKFMVGGPNLTINTKKGRTVKHKTIYADLPINAIDWYTDWYDS